MDRRVHHAREIVATLSRAPDDARAHPVRLRRVLAAALAGGGLLAASVPPAGFWPLGIAGVALLGSLLEGQCARARALVGLAGGVGLYGVTLWWLTDFNLAGGVVLILLEAAFLALAAVVTPGGRGRHAGWVGALVLQDWLRGVIPFGGLPLGGIPLGQAAGPLAPSARLGGELLLTGVTAACGVALEAVVRSVLARRGRRPSRRYAATGLVAALGAGLASAGGAVIPGPGAVAPIRVALVQGGGRRGLRAAQSSTALVVQRHLDASRGIRGPVDLIVWPEDAIAVPGPIGGTTAATDVAAIAASQHASLLAGVTEEVGTDRFRNAEVVWDSTGAITGRYDKVHRVPFGEYVPGRSWLRHLVSLVAIPRDAIAGTGSGEVRTQSGPVGIVISYEVFFSNRSRAAIDAGGQLLVVPTNTASYHTTQVPAAEVAADRLRAWETGRDVVMVAPTGFSAVVDARGRVLERSALGAQRVLEATLHRRTGRTLYLWLGDAPILAAAGLLVVGGVLTAGAGAGRLRRRRTTVEVLT